MTRDEVIRLAREAGLCDKDGRDEDSIIIVQYIEHFANLIAEHEREACAALCFQIWDKWMDEKDITPSPDAEDCAAAIRARELTSLQRQLIDADALQSDPTGLKARWQGLTDEEVDDMGCDFATLGGDIDAKDWFAFYLAIEAKLKEKNNG
jgi:hypothetical protein